MLKRRNATRSAAILESIAALERAYGNRIIPVDEMVVEAWTRLIGARNKDRWDLALAATAQVHGLVLVTRNVRDFMGRGVRLLDPFKDPPEFVEPA